MKRTNSYECDVFFLFFLLKKNSNNVSIGCNMLVTIVCTVSTDHTFRMIIIILCFNEKFRFFVIY